MAMALDQCPLLREADHHVADAIATAESKSPAVVWRAPCLDVKFDFDLGIGPRSHGTFVDESGKTNIVTDIVRGDFPAAVPQNITAQSFADLEEIFWRLDRAEVKTLNDFQVLVDDRGRLLVIDPGGARKIGEKPVVALDSENGDATRARASLTLSAKPEVARQYLAELRDMDPYAYEGLQQYYAARELPFPRE